MANSAIKVIYFNLPGRAEAIRLLLTLAGKKFEDVRINLQQWQEMKPTTPCGTIPIIEIDGKRFGQSRAIASYLARELGFYGETNLDGLKIDQIAHIAEDFVLEYGNKYFFVQDPGKKAEGEKVLREQSAPKYLGFFEKFLEEEGTGFTVGSSLSLGDVVVFDVCTGFLKPLVEESLSKFRFVDTLVTKIGNNERIQGYMSKREAL
ncbi:glutathione s-transferase [Plakobranchus ocellatus]|uniref:Glutathione s-transferase n=1 Tax=Plakobranchus ocellatus TaxID=259542 RepID=A0AAV4CDD4_9GAST|nr:glutathione s-transferase [Plakobranchus ocellatus]